MEKNSIFTDSLGADLAGKLDMLAGQSNCSPSSIIHQAVRHYVEDELQFRAAVQEGLDDLAAGRVMTHKDVLALLEKNASH